MWGGINKLVNSIAFKKLQIWRKEDYCMFEGKKAIILGERDGVPGPAIAACLEAAGAQIIFAVTECFV
jgi:glycine reductase